MYSALGTTALLHSAALPVQCSILLSAGVSCCPAELVSECAMNRIAQQGGGSMQMTGDWLVQHTLMAVHHVCSLLVDLLHVAAVLLETFTAPMLCHRDHQCLQTPFVQ